MKRTFVCGALAATLTATSVVMDAGPSVYPTGTTIYDDKGFHSMGVAPSATATS